MGKRHKGWGHLHLSRFVEDQSPTKRVILCGSRRMTITLFQKEMLGGKWVSQKEFNFRRYCRRQMRLNGEL